MAMAERRIAWPALLAWMVALAGTACPRALGADVEPCFQKLPPGWFVKKAVTASPDDVRAVGRRLGAPLQKLSNTHLIVHGQPLQVNVLHCATVDEAKTLHAAIAKKKGHPAYCIRSGTQVIEYVGRTVSVNLARKASMDLGFVPKPPKARYRIVAELAPLKHCDYMSCNRLFNQFLLMAQTPHEPSVKELFLDLTGRFVFGDTLTLRTCGKPVYVFQPKSLNAEPRLDGDATVYTFGNCPRRFDVPYMTVTMELETNESGLTPTSRKAGPELLAPTEFWPVGESDIAHRTKEITQGCTTPEAKVQAILRWLTPGKHIKSGGPVRGSRWGARKVLRQGLGHCWDSSDVFVTFCRTAGVPCRQVAGWMFGSCGHVWAEVLYEGKGWQQVDPTGGGVLPCGIYHIPYFVSEDGRMPILYVAMPRVEMR